MAATTFGQNPLFERTVRQKSIWLWVLFIGIVFISVFIYIPQQSLYFNLNDDIIILYRAMLNTWRIQLSPLHVLDVFRLEYFPLLGTRSEKYRPIHNLAALMIFPILVGNPLGYHIFALALHLLVVLALWRFVRHLGLSPPVAVGSALIFLLFFPASEVAVRFNAFPESLSAVFLLLASIFYIRALGSGRVFGYLLTIFLCTLASLTKVSAIVFLPFLFMIALFAQSSQRRLTGYSARWNWGTFILSSLIFLIVFIINTQVQSLQWQSVRQVMQGSLLDLIYIGVARPFMNLIPLGYPLPREVFFFDMRFYASMAGGIIIAAVGYWRVLKGDWLEKSLWILLYASIIHTLFLLPDARYEYLFGIPASILIARYGLLLWERIKSHALKVATITALALTFIIPQVINARAMEAESLELADYSRKTQQWAFDALRVHVRYPFERGLLVKKQFIPSDHFLSKLYLYTPYREEVERFYGVKLPKPEELGLPIFQPDYPMNEPTDWMKAKKKQ